MTVNGVGSSRNRLYIIIIVVASAVVVAVAVVAAVVMVVFYERESRCENISDVMHGALELIAEY